MNLNNQLCHCGRRAVVRTGGYFVCARCRAMERAARQRLLRRPLAGAADATVSHLQSHDRTPPKFICRIAVTARNILVQAHGNYSLQLA